MLFNLKNMLQWRPDAEEFTAPLVTPRPFRFRLERFPKGIDNIHIDVLLSQKFTLYSSQLIRNTLAFDAKVNLWKERASPPDVQQVEGFTRAYAGMMEGGTALARKQSRPELIQLLQFATLKYLLMKIDEASKEYREMLHKAAEGGQNASPHRSAQAHDRLVILAREEAGLKYRTQHKIFALVYKTETTLLRRSRKGVLGLSWPVPRELLFNPLLQLPSLWASEERMRHYPLLGIDEQDLQEFDRINRILVEIFCDYLPEWVVTKNRAATEKRDDSGIIAMRQRRDQGGLDGFLQVELLLSRALEEIEYREGRTCWLDDPENLKALFSLHEGVAWERRRDEESRDNQRRRQGFSLYLRERALAICDKHRLTHPILASHQVPRLYDQLKGEVPARFIMAYLDNDQSRRKLARRLAGLRGISDPPEVTRQLDRERQELQRLPKEQRCQQVADYLCHFALLRRDLKLGYQAYWIMNQLHLLEEREEIELSRGNRSLQEFALSEEQSENSHAIRTHTILKADLRGSTIITAQLREKNLNPATHFSLNFFDPVTRLLNQFGASKVFVEGDAVILALYEYEDEPVDWLAVSRTCGLARKILDVVDANNARNRQYQLPDLELGLGICYKNEAPTFLYDGDHQIMISSAINRADRLSGCAASLRSTNLAQRRRGVEVVAPVEQGIMQKSTSDNLLRYNVNGIELDEEAFNKLKAEISLRPIKGKVNGYSEKSTFYVGRYPDKSNAMQWLIIREAPIRLWIGNDVSTEEEWGRHFYEVITEPEILNQLKQLVSQRRAAKSNPDESGAAP